MLAEKKVGRVISEHSKFKNSKIFYAQHYVRTTGNCKESLFSNIRL